MEIVLLIETPMKRPQSAKPGYRGYWGQASHDQILEPRASGKDRKPVQLMKPDLTTHDFARVLPKKITHDKERLYSELLQMKQSLNEVMEENIRLKTKISILEKEKDKMSRYIDTAPEATMGTKANSRLNIYGSRVAEKENLMVRNLKKMVREGKEENEYLRAENNKIKKTIKYTRINEIQIEKKMVVDQNKRLSVQLEEMDSHLADTEALQNENSQLRRCLEEEIEDNKQLSQQKEKYQEIIEALEEKLKAEGNRSLARERKIQRDLAVEKRRLAQANRNLENMRKELKSSQTAQAEAMKKKAKPTRPLSSHPASSLRSGTLGRGVSTAGSMKPRELQVETEAIRMKNRQLEDQLKNIKVKLQESEYALKKKEKSPAKESRVDPKHDSGAQLEKIEKKSEKAGVKKGPVAEKQKVLSAKKEEDDVQSAKSIEVNFFGNIVGTDLPLPEHYVKKQKEDDDYEAEFDKEEEEYRQDDFQDDKVGSDPQIQKLKKDFEANQDEEELYRKEDSDDKKAKREKKEKKEKKQKKGKEGKGYKPDKKMLTEIKQLLTYRMKAQRYPFTDLQTDIQAAESQQFSYADLCNMLVNEPFYLTSSYTKHFLGYCFEKQNITDQEQLLKASVLIAKLRKVVNDFELIDEEEEKEMILRIAEMTSSYPAQLQNAFESIKNGEETVSKNNLTNMFQKLQLEDKYIELIVAELSLCSDDLQHLNFHGFFQRFYVDQGEENNAIQEEESEDSNNPSHRGSKGGLARGEYDYADNEAPLMMLAPEQPMTNKDVNFDDDEIVSDDGHI